MTRLALVAGALVGCAVPAEPPPETRVTCEEWLARAKVAPKIGEVLIDGAPFYAPGICYPAADGLTTWCHAAFVYDWRSGTIGSVEPESEFCEWRDAIVERTPARNTP